MYTLQNIADLSGVSRGTVDRVLNNRGSVSPKIEQRVRNVANTLKYSPNIAGKALASKKKKMKFGYILFDSMESNSISGNAYGIEKYAKVLLEYGVVVEFRCQNTDNPMIQAEYIDELIELGISGLVIMPIYHPLVIDRLKRLTSSGFPIITVNSDIPECGRLAYVGCNYYKSGEIAAGFINIVTDRKANIGIVIGSPKIPSLTHRARGFCEYTEKHFSHFRIIETIPDYDDDSGSFCATMDMYKRYPEIDVLYIVATGVNGVCNAVYELGIAEKIIIVCCDVTKEICDMIREGIISATVAQLPRIQSAKPLRLLFSYLCLGKAPENEINYTETKIVIKENLIGVAPWQESIEIVGSQLYR